MYRCTQLYTAVLHTCTCTLQLDELSGWYTGWYLQLDGSHRGNRVGALVADAEQVACAEGEVQSVDLGFGRIVVSEKETPNMLVNLV